MSEVKDPETEAMFKIEYKQIPTQMSQGEMMVWAAAFVAEINRLSEVKSDRKMITEKWSKQEVLRASIAIRAAGDTVDRLREDGKRFVDERGESEHSNMVLQMLGKTEG